MAVLVHRAGGGEPYYVQLLSGDGRGGGWATATTRTLKTYYQLNAPWCPKAGGCPGSTTANYLPPETSVSTTRVYFLDNDSDVKALSTDGTVKLITHLQVPANTQAMVSVSPDDRRMAVALLTFATGFTPPAFTLRIYVGDLVGGANRAELFESTTVAEWPVGWHAGNLVIAVGTPDVGRWGTPYAADLYHLADPATGRRLGTLDCASGPLVAAGTACATATSIAREGWDGAKTYFRLPNPAPRIFPAGASLSPDGKRIAAAVVADPQTGQLDTAVFGDGTEEVVAHARSPQGWLDDTHLIVSSAQEIDVLDLTAGTSTTATGLVRIAQQGMPAMFGVLPASLG